MSYAVPAYAVFGHPIQHSLSPQIHSAFAQQAGIVLQYLKIQPDLNAFTQAISDFIANGGRGANVTLPFKREAASLADRLTQRASLTATVNTLTFRSDVICGDSTDGIGLISDIEKNLGFNLQGQHILLLGAGGAAQAVVWDLLQCKPNSLWIANRTATKAQALAQQFYSYGNLHGSGFAALAQAKCAFDVIINATSSSLQQQSLKLPDTIYQHAALAYDMVYSNTTPFLQTAARQRIPVTANGLGMLVEQAAAAFHQWHGFHPETRSVIETLRTDATLAPEIGKTQ